MSRADRFGAGGWSLPVALAGATQLWLLAAVVAAASFLFYADTFASMVSVWRRSNTFVHGFLILPMSIFVLWQGRHLLRRVRARPSAAGFSLLLLAVALWALSTEGHVQAGRHFTFIAILVGGFWAVLGDAVASRLKFPLIFAFLAAPFGEFLIPPLMSWTAEFTVWALNLTGIPVFLQGYYFSLPSGDFEVIEACSGIRYLLVTVALAIFFAYERYRSQIRRLAFVAAATVAIIVANGIRAYLVVLAAHYSDMEYGTGQDHIYFGWVFFAVCILLIFWAGSRFSDRTTGQHSVAAADGDVNGGVGRGVAVAALAAVGIAALGPVSVQAARTLASGSDLQAMLPVAGDRWQGPAGPTQDYRPVAHGEFSKALGSYRREGPSVDLHGVIYQRQSQGNELVGQRNSLYDAERWRVVTRPSIASIRVRDRELDVNRLVLTNGDERLLLWYWYDISGRQTTSKIATKVYHALHSLTGQSRGDALVVVATETDGELAGATERLQTFLASHLDAIGDCLRVPAGQTSAACGLPE